ncbi:MAG: DNA-processing protein DprA [Bacteroidetes bacterium]|nr:DNA-processing protein DprA [Bacteroidota bacterium]
MTTLNDITCWMTLAHLPGWSVERINRLVVRIVHEEAITVSEFFALDKQEWVNRFAVMEQEATDLARAKADMPRLAFIAEQLLHEGFQVIPLNAPEYPITLREHLKVKNAPTLLYVKGRITLLQEAAVAIVGSRKAGATALEFTANLARKCVSEHKVVVSGYAQGVDRQALDSALAAGGRSIIVLPQGILTFQSGLKTYYRAIVNGDVLVLSTFFPKAGWEVGLAMARNAYIYGLADEIYAAESDNKGGTWQGVLDGLKRGREVYVRKPNPGEQNAHGKLIALGAIPVDMYGNRAAYPDAQELLIPENRAEEATKEPYNTVNATEKQILDLLCQSAFSAKEIIRILKLDWDILSLQQFLASRPEVYRISGKPLKYTCRNGMALTLF